MSIDWSATGDMIAGIGSIIGASAVLWAAVQSRKAISDWRLQKIVEREIQHAEAILAVAYQLQIALNSVRSRIMSGGELAKAEQDLNAAGVNLSAMDSLKRDRCIQRCVFYNRAEFHKNDFDQGFSLIPIAKAYFDPPVVDALEALLSLRNRVLLAADLFFELPPAEDPTADEVRKALWRGFGSSGDEDEVSSITDNSVSTISSTLVPFIKRNAVTTSLTKGKS